MSSYVIVWVLLILAWAANFVIRIGFSALLPSIIDELQLSYTRAGLLASAFFYAYVLMQIPSGLLGDRFGRRRVLLIGLVGGALAAGLTGLAGSLVTLFLARALTGAFQGSLFSNDRAIIATVTRPTETASVRVSRSPDPASVSRSGSSSAGSSSSSSRGAR